MNQKALLIKVIKIAMNKTINLAQTAGI